MTDQPETPAEVEARHLDEIAATAEWQADALKVLGEVETYARRMVVSGDAISMNKIVGADLLGILGERWTRQR